MFKRIKRFKAISQRSRLLKKAGIAVISLFLLFLLCDLIAPFKINIPFAPILKDKDGNVLHMWLAQDQQWRIKATLPEITPELQRAIVYKEDRYFYYHPGINVVAIARALARNMAYRRRTSGASTITMQVARLLEPKERTYFAKSIELFRALQLELHYSKREILEMYLNLIPCGGNIQGVKAASILYFNKTPDQLSLAEFAAISIIPNRPNSLAPGKNNIRLLTERNKWITRYGKAHLFPATTINDALAEPLIATRHNAPAGVPQLAWRLKSAYPTLPELNTSIDGKIQLTAENLAGNYLHELKLRHINNAAMLIIDNHTRQVVSYIGSADFMDQYNFGQVDGVRAIRSPGSTLKPLLYGMAFDKGLITPKTMIADVPVNIKGYTPENYDRLFRGNVTAEFALRNSLNIPAVTLLDTIEVSNFVQQLLSGGISSIQQKNKKLGLSVILGGCGIRLDELAGLYCAFANNGIYKPLQYLQPALHGNDDTDKPIQILTPGACYLLNRILTELQRPDLPNGYEQAQGIPKIAWKTGTSYGRKDAWSIGYNSHYTIGVWIGNFSGAGAPGLSGANTATPLLFRLFNAIDHNAATEWLDAPLSVGFRLVCAETGLPPATFCNKQEMDYYLPGISPNTICHHLKETWLSANEQYTYCTGCLPPAGYKTKLLPDIAPELTAFYEANGTPYSKLPPHNPECSRTFAGKAPVINSLTNGGTYIVADKQQLQLSCLVAGDVHTVYWYINNKFYNDATATGKLFFSPCGRVVKISCTDDKGRCSHIEIMVKYI